MTAPCVLIVLAAFLPGSTAEAGEAKPAPAGVKDAPGAAGDPAALLREGKESFRKGQDALEGRGPQAEPEPILRKAAASFEEILRLHPDHPAASEAALFLGTTRLLLDEMEPALAAYRRSYDGGAGFKDRGLALLRAGICQAGLDRPAEALATFQRFLREFPDQKSDAAKASKLIGEMALVGRKAPPLQPASWMNGIAEGGGLKAFEGQPVVLVFLATWCPNCRKEIPHLRMVMKKLSSSDVVFLGVLDPDDPRKTASVEAYIQDNRLDFLDVALDRGGKCQAAFRVSGFPAAALIDRKGIVRWRGHLAFFPGGLLGKVVGENEKS